MTVAELIEELNKLPPTLPIIIQKDSEGNSYSPLYGVDENGVYQPNSPWSGDVIYTTQSWEEAGFDSKEDMEYFISENTPCCVLYPIN